MRRSSLLAPLLLGAALALPLAVAPAPAQAAETSLALGEVAPPPPSSGVDRATLKSAAERELSVVDASRVKKKRAVVVSVAITSATDAPYGCTVNALLRDAKSGTMIAILEGRARAEGNVSPDLRKAVLRAAVRSAVSQIPDALSAN